MSAIHKQTDVSLKHAVSLVSEATQVLLSAYISFYRHTNLPPAKMQRFLRQIVWLKQIHAQKELLLNDAADPLLHLLDELPSQDRADILQSLSAQLDHDTLSKTMTSAPGSV
jgi:hypothetical protein